MCNNTCLRSVNFVLPSFRVDRWADHFIRASRGMVPHAHPGQMAWQFDNAALQPFPAELNRIRHSLRPETAVDSWHAHVLIGEPVSTSPEHAIMFRRRRK